MKLRNDEPSPPKPGETLEQYCTRLETEGFEEMQVRKAIRKGFNLPLDEVLGFLNQHPADKHKYPASRLRHILLLRKVYPQGYGEDDKLGRKVSRNLSISQEDAKYWVTQIRRLETNET